MLKVFKSHKLCAHVRVVQLVEMRAVHSNRMRVEAKKSEREREREWMKKKKHIGYVDRRKSTEIHALYRSVYSHGNEHIHPFFLLLFAALFLTIAVRPSSVQQAYVCKSFYIFFLFILLSTRAST